MTMFNKLAIQNIRNNKNTFGPFAICTATMVALFYMILSITKQVQKGGFYGADAMNQVMVFGCWVCGIFSVMVILYTNNFMIKKRSKELGLYSMLGMDKKHISKVLFWEMADSGLASILVGLAVGLSFSKLVFMGMEKLIKLNTGIKFTIEAKPVITTVCVFVTVFAIAIIFNFIRVFRMKPIELMRSTRFGEKEPKANWFIAILGIACLGIGYYIAITTENPIKAMSMFFIAVLFVIAGTYFTFISGAVAILKLLKKNKNYFYKKNHFVTISGLIYRMKANAVGLANICILSTAVLVILFSTSALLIGTEESIDNNYPEDVFVSCSNVSGKTDSIDVKKFEEAAQKSVGNSKLSVKDVDYKFFSSVVARFDGDALIPTEQMDDFDNISLIYIASAEDFSRKMGREIQLAEDEFLWHSSIGREFKGNELVFGDKKMKMAGNLEDKYAMDDNVTIINETATMIVKDTATVENLTKSINKMLKDKEILMSFSYSYNLDGSIQDKTAYGKNLEKAFKKAIPEVDSVSCKNNIRQDYFNLYGSLFFIGIFIGIMFMVTTVMIIYYKQISEGYEDREKFQILKKVGMSDKEIKATIRSQILTVFFIPIIVAVIHIAAAFKAIQRIMMIFGITSLQLLIGCLVATVLIYIVVYALIYGVTAKSYYKCLM